MKNSEVKKIMADVLNLIFTQDFLIRALIVGILISLCSALLGVSLVLKRFSMIGDGLSHVGFGAMAIACAVNVAPLYFALPIVIISAFLLLKMNETGKIKGDAAIALISTGALAVGVMATSVTTGMNIDIYNYMFGSILTMTRDDVFITALLSAVVIVLFVIFYNEIFAVTFDESFAKATGTKTSFYNMLIAALTAVTIVIGMRMMGALLISSLIIFPTVTSMRVCKSFRKVIIFSIIISVFCFVSGLLLSVKYETPTGASVVCFNIFVFAVFFAVKTVLSSNFYGRKYLNKLFAVFIAVLSLICYFTVMLTGENYNLLKKEKITVVSTAFAQYDFAKNIIGDNGEVYMLLSPGEESHTYEPTPSDILRIKECDLFIYGGGESEKWVDGILASFNKEINAVRMMDVVELYEEEHTDSENHNHQHEHHYITEEYDEHVWTSPYNAISISQAICDALAEIDTDNSFTYKDNTEKYINELRKLDNEFKSVVKNGTRNLIIIGDRFPLRYLTERYGIDFLSAYPGCSAQAEVNPVTVANLIEHIKSEKIPVVFKVDLSTGNVANSISEATGADVLSLYSCHVISAEDFNNGESYISLMKRNLRNIEISLG